MKLLVTIVIVGALVTALVFKLLEQSREMDSLRQQIAALEDEKTQLESELETLKAGHLEASELERLKAVEREVIKLRGDLVSAKNALSDAQRDKAAALKKASAASAGNAQSQGELTDPLKNPYARVSGSKASANIPNGHGIILGNFDMAAGRRTFAVAIPTRDEANPNAIAVETKWFQLDEDAMANPEIANALSLNGTYSTRQSDELRNLFKRLEATTGVDLLSSPRISTSSGQEAVISVSSVQPTPSGPLEVGPSMKVTPIISADGSSIDLAIEAQLTQLRDPPEAGRK